MSLQRELAAIRALLHWAAWGARRHPFLLLGEIVRPVFWLAFVGMGMRVLGSGRPLDGGSHGFVFAGVLVLTVLQSGLRRGGFLVEERRSGLLRALSLAPASTLALVLGIVLSNTIVVTLQALVFTAIAGIAVLGLPVGTALPLVATIALVAAGTVAFGLWLGSLPWRPGTFRTVLGILTLPAFFLSGGVIPLDRTPGWLHPVIRANPMTYGVDLIRHAMGGPTSFPLGADLASGGAFAAAMTVLAWVVFHRRLLDLRAQGPVRARPRPVRPEADAVPVPEISA